MEIISLFLKLTAPQTQLFLSKINTIISVTQVKFHINIQKQINFIKFLKYSWYTLPVHET